MAPCPALRLYPGLQLRVFLHDIHVTPTLAKASPSQQGNSISRLEIKIEKLGGGGVEKDQEFIYSFN